VNMVTLRYGCAVTGCLVVAPVLAVSKSQIGSISDLVVLIKLRKIGAEEAHKRAREMARGLSLESGYVTELIRTAYDVFHTPNIIVSAAVGEPQYSEKEPVPALAEVKKPEVKRPRISTPHEEHPLIVEVAEKVPLPVVVLEKANPQKVEQTKQLIAELHSLDAEAMKGANSVAKMQNMLEKATNIRAELETIGADTADAQDLVERLAGAKKSLENSIARRGSVEVGQRNKKQR
jgi:hypothetical protein